MDERSRQRQFEDQFLRQLRTRAQALLRRAIPADQFTLETLPDGVDSVRATLTRLERFDRGLLEKLPGTQAIQLRFKRRVFGPLRKTVVRLRAQVLAPIEELVAEEAPGPIGREQVQLALDRYTLLPEGKRPTAAVFASATGFTPEARALVHAGGQPTVILMGGREDGGWDVEMPQALRRTPWAQLFDLESQDERLKRLLYHLDKNAGQLEARGVSVAELAEQLGLPREQVEGLVRQACRNDSQLMTVVHEGTVHVCRSPLAEEGHTMSLWSRIRKLLRLKPTPAERVRILTAQRVRLEQQRHELDGRVNALETEEREAVERGAAAKTDVERKQLAGKLVRARRELRRVRAQANVFTQQIDIIGTHIHHQTLAEQGKRVELPKAEDLTREAAEAEQIMAELSANADLAANIEVGAESPLMAEEEAAIFAEFKEAAGQQAPEQASTAPEAEKTEPASAAPDETPVPPEAEKDKTARPELG
ncbi:MAG: hypothetical protein KAY37_05325 [Phycisphaerae bacterium]|nr:hypothetical protein [Phycisphaerae bacterium]